MQQETIDDVKQQGLAMVYYALGKRRSPMLRSLGMIKEYADESAFEIAEVYAFRGQSDEAMHWLERAYVQKDNVLYSVKGDLPLKSLEADPRFKAFLRQMNLPE